MNSPLPIIVIAEDSRVQGRILQQRLNAAGYEAHIGENGVIALQLVQTLKPVVVVSDIEMPKMNGYELCSEIKKCKELRHIPVILLSTLSDAEDIIRGLAAGADNYITKPYDVQFLITRIEDLRSQPVQEYEEEGAASTPVALGGQIYEVRAGRQQTLNLLVSVFENAVEKNKELHRSNEHLVLAKEKLSAWNYELAALNGQLNDLNGRMQRDLRAAARMQQSLLPNEPLAVSGIQVAWDYTPCEELAGDFLNFAKLDENTLGLYVVDVCGHGAASALLAVAIGRVLTPTASATSLLVRFDPLTGRKVVTPPATVIEELNRRFPMDSQGGLHFTILYGLLDLRTNIFRYSCGGHPQPVHVPSGQSPRLLPGEGLAVGWVEDATFDEYTIELESGDRLFLYSDGVPEAMDANLDQFTDQKMLNALQASRSSSVQEQVAHMKSVVEQWCQPKGPLDDVSMLLIEVGCRD
ncbi:Phosphoserine phosphatase RsbP [Pirellula sp. SH-Sr6A]|uniref:fused response regulator/phosphatase n=1 Tax=Pirellula sp. SH-Sr6A TaxID=1632865 RepID=UPI00078EEB4A|nr:fused response regulator/phosphatase [Pirellula sp. SH-Sr6A]AMV35408.1 Phosphoserine phosphatase RsbP [Pirellula sp. SH-Sr6A]